MPWMIAGGVDVDKLVRVCEGAALDGAPQVASSIETVITTATTAAADAKTFATAVAQDRLPGGGDGAPAGAPATGDRMYTQTTPPATESGPMPVLQTLQPLLADADSPDPAAKTAGASPDLYSLCHPLLHTVPVLITSSTT